MRKRWFSIIVYMTKKLITMDINFIKNTIEHSSALKSDFSKPQDNLLGRTDIALEYSSLRTEILHNETFNMQLFGGAILIVAAAMGFAFKAVSLPMIQVSTFCGVVGILCIIIRQTLDRIRMTFIIAAYLRHFVEPKLEGVKWETRLTALRKRSGGIMFDKQNNLIIIYLFLGLINCLLALLYILKLSEKLKIRRLDVDQLHNRWNEINDLELSLFVLILSTFLLVWTWRHTNKMIKRYIHKNEEYVEKEWEDATFGL